MPNANTFSIKPIKNLISRYHDDSLKSIDPFANKARVAKITNDLDPSMGCDHNLEAVDFLKLFADGEIDIVYYDPPFSVRQVSEVYKKLGKTVNHETTRSDYWTKMKVEIARVVKPGGLVLSFGWNSGGIGKTLGFEIVEILLVPHGGIHNDTICTVEKKK